jgi:predicted anti-sigma-YlaC factor YlaD
MKRGKRQMQDLCSQVLKLLGKYFDQEATNKEKLLVESHLQVCPACLDVLRSMEELRTFIKVPVEAAAQEEDFPWVWQKIERELRSQRKPTWLQSLRPRLDISPLLKKKIWIPAVATFAVLLMITAQLIFKETPSYPGLSDVEYLESEDYNVMVYQSENQKVTVIWLFEGPEKGASPS